MKVNSGKSKKKKITVIIVSIFAALIIIAYIVTTNILVSACLVPSFMSKLDAFDRITIESYSDQVQTTELKENQKMLEFIGKEWFENSSPEIVHEMTEDGYELTAALVYAKEPSDKWAIVLHGYTGWKEEMYLFAAWYNENGYNVIVPDQRCQGKSQGDFIGMGYTDSFDTMLWVNRIISEDQNAQIVLHGQSMGAATALIMSGREMPDNIKVIISDSTYTDAYSMFGQKLKEWFKLPAFPLVDGACIMLRIRGGYDLRLASPVDAVAKSKVPTLFIHGTEDKMISVDNAYKLYDAASCEKELYIVDGVGHGQTQDKKPEEYFMRVEEFTNRFFK